MFKVLYCDKLLVKRHLAEALVMSGLPMRVDVNSVDLNEEIESIGDDLFFETVSVDNQKVFNRAINLGNALTGSGHDCCIKGVVVTAIVNAPAYWWTQFQRYHFADIISSQSKMHRVLTMNLEEQCSDNVDPMIITLLRDKIKVYNLEEDKAKKKILFDEIIACTPQGLTLTAGIVTNYLQLKTMYLQRKNHKMEDWSRDFSKWVLDLPYFKELCLKEII